MNTTSLTHYRIAGRVIRGCRCHLTLAFLALGALVTSCAKESSSGTDIQLTSLGSAEVTGRLLEIAGEFPANDLYNYAYVLKYRVLTVHRGKVDGKEIFIAHYNPLKPRSSVQDEVSGKVGGNLKTFKAGEIHRMALEGPLDQHWMGGIIDKYFGQPGIRYWAVWTNLVENIQQAIEAPRWSTRSFAASQFPHTMYPGEMTVEERIPESVRTTLKGKGQRLKVSGPWSQGSNAGIVVDLTTGVLHAGPTLE